MRAATALSAVLLLLPLWASVVTVEVAAGEVGPAADDAAAADSIRGAAADSIRSAEVDSSGRAGAPADTIAASGADSTETVPSWDDSLLARYRSIEGAISYRAERIQSRIAEKTILLNGDARVRYGGTTLQADSIRYDYETGRLWAWGSPVLVDEQGEVAGKRMSYSMNEKKGIIEEGSTSFDEWLFDGAVVSRVGERDIYGKETRFTTCDLQHPHYHFAATRLKLTIDEKVIARPVILYVRNVPVFLIPFYVFPIQKGRKSGFLRPKFGIFNDEVRGRSITDFGYFFAVNEYFDLTLATDLYERSRFAFRGEGRYASRYSYKGSVFYSFTEDVVRSSRRSILSFRHDQTLNPEATLFVEGNFASDRTIYDDISFDIDEVLQRSLESRATYNRRADWGSWYVTGYNDFSLDQDRTVTQFPLFRLSKSASPLFPGRTERWYGGISYNLGTGFEASRIEEDGDRVIFQSSQTRASISDPMKWWGWLNVTPRLDLSGTVYHTGKDGTGTVHQETYGTSVSLFTRLYGIFSGPRVGRMTRWRHTISPQVTYRYRPDVDSERFAGLPRFPGAGGEANSFTFTLNNDFDAKYLDESGEEKDISLLSVIHRTSYSVLRAREAGRSGWGDLGTRIESSPVRRFRFSVDMSHSLFDGETFDPFLTALTTSVALTGRGGVESDTLPMEAGSLPALAEDADAVVSDRRYASARRLSGAPWSLSLNHTLTRSRTLPDARQTVSGSVSFQPSTKWRLSYGARYSFEEDRVQNQQLTLRRELHRWELLLSFNDLPEGRFSYELRVNLIDLPSLEIKRSVRDF